MTRLTLAHRRSVIFCAFSAVAVVVVAACAESGEGPTPPTLDSGAPNLPPADGGDTDAGEAGARTCSDQGFCHVVLPTDETLRDVWGDGTTVWAVSEQGDVLRWDGQTWSVHTERLGALYAIWGSGATDIWIGGARGLFHGTGASSQSIVFAPVGAPGDPDVPILSIWGEGPDDVFAAGGYLDPDLLPHGRVLHRRGVGDAGAPWTLDPLSAEPLVFNRVWGSAAVGTWIAGDDGTENAQTAGVFVRAPGEADLVAVAIDASPPNGTEPGAPGLLTGGGIMADGRVVVVGQTTSGTRTFWYAATSSGGAPAWSYEVREDADLALYAVWAIPGQETWVAGDYGRLRSRGPSDGKWTQAAMMIADLPVVEPLYGIWGTSPDDFWVVGRRTAIHRVPRKEP